MPRRLRCFLPLLHLLAQYSLPFKQLFWRPTFVQPPSRAGWGLAKHQRLPLHQAAKSFDLAVFAHPLLAELFVHAIEMSPAVVENIFQEARPPVNVEHRRERRRPAQLGFHDASEEGVLRHLFGAIGVQIMYECLQHRFELIWVQVLAVLEDPEEPSAERLGRQVVKGLGDTLVLPNQHLLVDLGSRDGPVKQVIRKLGYFQRMGPRPRKDR
mmetsp:Transcript_65571/g.182301  ORF Transcript_65571/g.182301 Transcript_65571/m.182301 type:complete len:212 (-) Transcript_65571:1314-1949(-)